MKKLPIETIVFYIFILITSIIIVLNPEDKKEINIKEYQILINYETEIELNLKEPNFRYLIDEIKTNELLKEIPTNKKSLLDIKNKINFLKQNNFISKKMYNNFFKYILTNYENELIINREDRKKIEIEKIKNKFLKG